MNRQTRANIVIYRENLLPYSETFILSQAEALRQFRPHYVGMRRVTGGIATPSERTMVLNDGSGRGRMAELAYKASGFAPRLYTRLKRLKPKLIHAHFGLDGVLALPISRRLRLPLIVTFHGFDATMRDEYLLAVNSRRSRRIVTHRPQLIREGAMFIAVSEHIRRQLLAKGFPPERVVTHYNGIDVSVFSPAPEGEREDMVMFVGRLVEKKGGEYLLRAMQVVQRRFPWAQLVMVGDGPLRGELENLAEELQLSCRFLGRQTPAQVRNWMRVAQLFCVPSVTAENGDSEGLPTVILEAMAMGVPVVATSSAGNPEAVRHNHTGLIVPERDVAALAEALIRLMDDAALRLQFRRAGLEDVHRRFDARRLIGGLEQLYLRVLNEADERTHQPLPAGQVGDPGSV